MRSTHGPDVFIEAGDSGLSNWLGTARSLGQQGVNVLRLSSKGWYSSKYCKTIISPS
ncbi:MAG: hypothetical protein QXX08_02400 [Candidatus Bathyarchaeia archaeon]